MLVASDVTMHCLRLLRLLCLRMRVRVASYVVGHAYGYTVCGTMTSYLLRAFDDLVRLEMLRLVDSGRLRNCKGIKQQTSSAYFD